MDNPRSALTASLTAGFGRDIPPRMGSAPGFELSCTPGGTIFSTTPGGTRIMYDRSAMLNIRNSPMSRTPPVNMLQIPGVTTQASPHGEHAEEQQEEANASQPELFDMDD